MWILLLRTVITYGIIMFTMRLMGKKQLGQLQPSELVSTILISNLASISIESPELPISGSIVPVLAIAALEILISALSFQSPRAAGWISGHPRAIIRDGRIDQQTLRDLRFSVDDLMEALRSKDVFELSEVAFAMVETNGTISVCRKFEASTPTNDAFGFQRPQARQPSLPIITDGSYVSVNLKAFGVTEDWARGICAEKGCTVKQTLLLLCNDAHETLLIPKENPK